MSQTTTAVTPEVLSGVPPAPETVEETGIRQAFLEDLALKILCVAGPMSLRELSDHIRLKFGVVNELLRRLRSEQLCEVTGMHSNIPQIAITSSGRSRAIELLSMNQYTGSAPVSLASYIKRVQQQSVRQAAIHRSPCGESTRKHRRSGHASAPLPTPSRAPASSANP